jgi:predicted negative regulator of RcsB-dependent stress response
MPRPEAAARTRSPADFGERAETFFEWIQTHTREVALGAALVIALGLGAWLYVRTAANKEERAYESLLRANEAVQAKNWPLAQSDLEKMVRRYADTPSGEQAELLLSEVLYETGKYRDGITRLEHIASSVDRDRAPLVEAQIAAGYEQLQRFDVAASHYTRAADKARFTTDRDLYLANAARDYSTAGNAGAARQIWARLAADETSPVAGEARLRLGELTAAPAKRS